MNRRGLRSKVMYVLNASSGGRFLSGRTGHGNCGSGVGSDQRYVQPRTVCPDCATGVCRRNRTSGMKDRPRTLLSRPSKTMDPMNAPRFPFGPPILRQHAASGLDRDQIFGTGSPELVMVFSPVSWTWWRREPRSSFPEIGGLSGVLQVSGIGISWIVLI
jgi:hypothetical protein